MAVELARADCLRTWEHSHPDVSESHYGCTSFRSFNYESLNWERWSAFTRNRCQEELERLRSSGLVASRKAFFENHYNKTQAQKDMSENQQSTLTPDSVEQYHLTAGVDKDIPRKNCNLESNVGPDIVTATNVLHSANFDAVKSDCNTVQEKAKPHARKCKENTSVTKKPVASIKNGLKKELGSQRNTSQPQKTVGMTENNVGLSNTTSDRVLRNFRSISVASHKPHTGACSKVSVPCPLSFGKERRATHDASILQDSSRKAARTASVKSKGSEFIRASEQVRERTLPGSCMGRLAAIPQQPKGQKNKGSENKRGSEQVRTIPTSHTGRVVNILEPQKSKGIKRISKLINVPDPTHSSRHVGSEYRSTVVVRKDKPGKEPVASVRNGLKVELKNRTKKSQPPKYQLEQIFSMMKNKRQKELESLNSAGLVTLKIASFEEHKRNRALIAMKENRKPGLIVESGGHGTISGKTGNGETNNEPAQMQHLEWESTMLESLLRKEEFEQHDTRDLDQPTGHVRKYKDNVLVFKAKGFGDSVLKGLNVDLKNQKNKSKLPKCQVPHIISNTKNNRVSRNCIFVPGASHKPLANGHFKASFPCSSFFGTEKQIRDYAPTLQDTFKRAAKTSCVKKGLENKRGSEQEQERPSRTVCMESVVNIPEPSKNHKSKSSVNNRGSKPIRERTLPTGHLGRVSDIPGPPKARISNAINLPAPNHSNPRAGSANISTIALGKNKGEVAPSLTGKGRRILSGGMSPNGDLLRKQMRPWCGR